MKKLLLSLAAVVGIGLASSAATETIDFFGTGEAGTITQGPLTVTFAKNDAGTPPTRYSDGVRIYYNSNGNGGSMTISCASGSVITAVDFTMTSGYSWPSDACGNVGTLSGSNWTSNGVSSVTFQNTYTENKQQVRVAKMTVTYTDGEGGGGTVTPEPDPTPGPDEPEGEEVTETWKAADTGITAGTSANAPTTPTPQTSTATGIQYTFYQTVVNSQNYLFLKGGNSAGYISWSLDYAITAIKMKTSPSNSKDTGNKVTVYAGDVAIQTDMAVNATSTEYTVNIPAEYQAAGTVYKVLASGSTNTQFASFTYVKGEGGGTVDPDPDPDDPQPAENMADFNTLSKNTSYGTNTTTNGWVCTNSAVVEITLDGTTYLAPTLNGKTTAVGTITSPTLNNGLGTLSFQYENTYNETNGVSVRIDIMQNGKVANTYTLINEYVNKSTAYDFDYTFNVPGDFQIVITNLSPSNSSNNNDRVSIFNLTWTNYEGVAKEPAGIAYTEESVTIEKDGTYTLPTLENPNDLTVTYSSSNTSVATVGNDGTVEVVGLGKTIITAKSAATEKYHEGEASYTLIVTPAGILTVAEAIELINSGYEGLATIKGIVVKTTYFNSNYGSVTYYISDNGEDEGSLQVYGGLGLEGAKFTSQDDVQVGYTVVVKGNVKLYNEQTPEVDSNSVMLEYTAPVAEPEFELSYGSGNITDTEGEVFYYITAKNVPTDAQVTVTVKADGLTTQEKTFSAEPNNLNGSILVTGMTPGQTYIAELSVKVVIGSKVYEIDPAYVQLVANKVIYVVGDGNGLGWNLPGTKYVCSDDVATFTIDNLSGFKVAPIETTVWDEFNTEALFTTSNFNTGVLEADGQTLPMSAIGKDAAGSRNQLVPWTGNYTITINLKEMTMTAFTETPEPTEMPDVYLRGGMNSWNAQDAWKLTYNEETGEYTFNCEGETVINAGQAFKFADSGYSVVNYGYNDGAITPSDAQVSLAYNGGDITLSESFQGTITFKITDKYNKEAYAVFASTAVVNPEPEHIYIIGNIEGHDWDIANPIELQKNDDGVFAIGDIVLGAGDGTDAYFALISVTSDNNNWNYVNSNRFGPQVNNDAANVGENDVYKTAGEDGSGTSWCIAGWGYSLSFDYANMKLYIDYSTGITDVESEAAQGVRFFNLQGVEVASPAAGNVYIKVVGNTATKVLVK